jgi:hypothetical protein
MNNKDSILIWTDSIDNSPIIKHGIELAQNIGTNYCILCHTPKSESFTCVLPDGEIIQSKRKNAASFIFDNKRKLGLLFVITDVEFSGKVLSRACNKKIKIIKKTELACICIKENFSIDTYKNILCVAGYEKGEKEKIMWANFFGKKLKAMTHIMLPNEKDEYIGKNINNINYFANKLLTQMGNSYCIHKSNKTTEALKKQSTFEILDNSSLIIVNIQYINFNPFKRASDILHIERSGNTACMIVPETDDSLIPCH